MATPSSVPLPLTGDNVIDAATNGFYWQLDSSRTINWALADGFFGESWISPANVAAILASVFKNISSYANVQFNYVGYYSDPSTAYFAGSDITISLGGSGIFGSDTSTWAFGLFPDASYNALYLGASGDIFLNINSQANFLPSYAPGSAGYALAIHEIGHTLGLKHPFDDGGTGHPTLEQLGVAELNKDWFTVMAYNDDYDYNLRFWDPATPMVMDVLALQYLYGKNNTTNATNTTYTLFLNGTYQTIWDAGGTDVINVSQSSVGWAIQLPIFQISALVDTKVGFALPASEVSLSSPLTLYWLTGDIENITGSSFDDTLFGNDSSNSLVGNAGSDTLNGGLGNDTLNGGLGADSMAGGLGDDTYTIDSLGDSVTELVGEGTDTVRINRSVDLTLSLFTEIENVVLTGVAALNATGDDGNNLLTGNSAANILTGGDGTDQLTGKAGNDLLNGGAGDDAMEGGAGNDTYVVNSLGDSVTETLAGAAGGTDLVQSAAASFTLGANVENLTLTGSADINGTGNILNNILTGNSGHNTLSGDAGNDKLIGALGNDNLDGGAGTDNMAGGLGDDTYVVDVATDVVTEALNAGTDTVFASRNYTLGANVENLTLTGLAINGTGNALNNVLTGTSGDNTLSGLAGNDQLDGGDGNDTINGGLGIDAMTGGSGDDLFILDRAIDTVIEASGVGSDTVRLAYNVVVPTLLDLNSDYGGNVENVQVTGTGVFNLTGNVSDNALTGNGSNNILIGNDGNDTLSGLAGNDRLDGGTGNDTLIGGTGNDTFLFGLGDGQDLVQDNSGSADKMLFDGGINPLDLVISRQVNDLRLAIHGSSDQITVQNWYTSSVNRTETIQAGNGETLLSTQVDQLIQAMAGFTQQTGLTRGIRGSISSRSRCRRSWPPAGSRKT